MLCPRGLMHLRKCFTIWPPKGRPSQCSYNVWVFSLQHVFLHFFKRKKKIIKGFSLALNSRGKKKIDLRGKNSRKFSFKIQTKDKDLPWLERGNELIVARIFSLSPKEKERSFTTESRSFLALHLQVEGSVQSDT